MGYMLLGFIGLAYDRIKKALENDQTLINTPVKDNVLTKWEKEREREIEEELFGPPPFNENEYYMREHIQNNIKKYLQNYLYEGNDLRTGDFYTYVRLSLPDNLKRTTSYYFLFHTIRNEYEKIKASSKTLNKA